MRTILIVLIACSTALGCRRSIPVAAVPAKAIALPAGVRMSLQFSVAFHPVSEDGRVVAVVVSGLDGDALKLIFDHTDQLNQALVVGLLPEAFSNAPLQPMLGSITLSERELMFVPKFPLLAGEAYVARFDPSVLDSKYAGAGVVESRYVVPSGPASAPPMVRGITPSGDMLPANHLKFYVTFSEPMQQGTPTTHFRLLNRTTGEEVPDAFRDTELWDDTATRLTLWFHPGRQKDGVNLNVELGPILVEGNDYELTLSGDWKSQVGVPLGQPFVKKFKAGPVDRQQPKLADWNIIPPQPGLTSLLLVELGEPLDAALLRSGIHVQTAAGEPLAGKISLEMQESVWCFEPAEPLAPGKYRLVVNPLVEDLAGNSFQRPFEVDLTAPQLQPEGASPALAPPSPPPLVREFEMVP